MNAEQRKRRRTADIHVTDYLAIWARQKFETDAETGGLLLPPTSDLYHCVWHLMERGQGAVSRGQEDGEPNLRIHLPYRRRQDGVEGKDPAFWNYLSPHSARHVERQLLRLFNWEFHRWMEDNHLSATPQEAQERVRAFIRRYQLGLDCEDTLKKNWQRHLRAVKVLLGITKKGEKAINPNF